jgi:hypothetical protein
MTVTRDELVGAIVAATIRAGGVAPREVHVHPRDWNDMMQGAGVEGGFRVAGIPVRLDPEIPEGHFCIRS